MGWNSGRSLERAQAKYDETEGLTVLPLVRETDFADISLKEPRLVHGAHAYVHVPNYKTLLGQGETDEAMISRTHIWARETTRVVEGDFEAVKIHFQGPRLHAVSYRPIGSDDKIAARAVLAAAAVRATTKIFNDVLDLPEEERWKTCGGIDFGKAIATRIGVAGDRELLFLGSPANQAAHLIATGLSLTTGIAQLLPEDLASFLKETPDGRWRFELSDGDLESLALSYGYTWRAEGSRQRLENDVEQYPESCAKVVDAAGEIDKRKLGLGNTKRVEAVSFFADVDGFTAYVEKQEEAEDLEEAVRAWHVIRSEMRNTAVVDFGALRIQYQGDRMQGLAYLPIGDEEAIALKAIRIAAALTSVSTVVLPDVVSKAALPLAIGMAVGTTLVSRLGEHGDRDVVSLASATAAAAAIQQRLAGGEIGIDKALRDLLPGWLQQRFEWRVVAQAYVIEELTLAELERLEASESPDPAKAFLSALAGTGVGAAATRPIKRRRPDDEPSLRPYLP